PRGRGEGHHRGRRGRRGHARGPAPPRHAGPLRAVRARPDPRPHPRCPGGEAIEGGEVHANPREATLPHARGIEHGTAHRRGPGALEARTVEAWALLSRGKTGARRVGRKGPGGDVEAVRAVGRGERFSDRASPPPRIPRGAAEPAPWMGAGATATV